MESPHPLLSNPVDTVYELRELYRAAESRAARLRLLSSIGQDLALADAASILDVIQTCVDRIAHFLGKPKADLHFTLQHSGIAAFAPGTQDKPAAWLSIEGVSGLQDIIDNEDRDVVRMALELIGATLNRFEQERDRAMLLAALGDRERRLEFVVSRLFSAQEEERRRLSHELHDGVAQTATALVRLLEGGGEQERDTLDTNASARLGAIARDLVGEIRSIIAGLRPTLLDDLGLQAALRFIADNMAADGYDIDFQFRAPARSLPSHVETALYRVAQEATNNIRKHAGGPCRVEMHIAHVHGEGAYCLRIRDFGRGIKDEMRLDELERFGHHVGIQVMQERMIAVNGKLEWEGSEGGVTVTASIGQSA